MNFLSFNVKINSPRAHGHSGRSLYIAMVAVVSLSVLLNLAAAIYQLWILSGMLDPKYSYIGNDRPRDLPIKLRKVNMVFHDDPEHYALSGAKAWAEWNTISPRGKGFFPLGHEHLFYAVSMWHQLHCLNHIRTVLISGDDGPGHTEHCFHYIRQAILCAADTTLEPGGIGMRQANGAITASSIRATHTCGDWRQVFDHIEEQVKGWTEAMSAPRNVTFSAIDHPSDHHHGMHM